MAYNYYEKHKDDPLYKEKQRERQRRWREKHKDDPVLKEQRAEYAKQWYEQNKGYASANAKKWRKANPEKNKQLNRESYRRRVEKGSYVRENKIAFWRCRDAKIRSAQIGVPFDLDEDYVQLLIVDKCPVFGFELSYKSEDQYKSHFAQLDRIVPELGYTKGNVQFLSRRANILKNNATREELLALASFLCGKPI